MPPFFIDPGVEFQEKKIVIKATIPSASQLGLKYQVERTEEGEWSCNCPAFAHTRIPESGMGKSPCKHIKIVMEVTKTHI